MPESATTKRPYLSRNERRAQLLDCAAAIVDRDGWAELTMVNLAKEANASRQLVYQHFASVEELVRETSDYLFAGLVETITAEHRTPGISVAEAVERSARVTFELPPGRVAALTQLLARPFDKNDPISGACRRARRASLKVTLPIVEREMPHLPERERAALASLFDMAIWSAHTAVSDGATDKESAIRAYVWAIQRLLYGDRAGDGPGTQA